MPPADQYQRAIERCRRRATLDDTAFDPVDHVDAGFDGVLIENARRFELRVKAVSLVLQADLIQRRRSPLTLCHTPIQSVLGILEVGRQAPSAFGRTDPNGEWIPGQRQIEYVSECFYLGRVRLRPLQVPTCEHVVAELECGLSGPDERFIGIRIEPERQL